MEIKIPYKPRPWQQQLHNITKRFNVIVAHRGSGKSIYSMNEVIKQALIGPSLAQYAYILPQLTMGRRNVWDAWKYFASAVPETRFNNTLMETRFPNETRVHILGADDPDALRGLHLHGVVLDEYSDMHADTWKVVRPMLTNHKGWVIWIGTPKGRNSFYDMYMRSQEPDRPSWMGVIMPWFKTNALSLEEVEQARSEMSPEEFSQELECFPVGSLVATADDVRPIEELKTGDLVWTHSGRVRPISAVMSKPFYNELVVIESYGSRPLRLTPEHPIYTYQPSGQTYTWKPASKIVKGDWLVTPKKHRGIPIVSAEVAELIAWFIAEGSVNQNQVTFSLNEDETIFIERIHRCLNSLGRESKVYIDRGAARVTCCDVTLADMFVTYCGSGAENKRVPLSLIGGHEQLVFDTLIDGDGCIHRSDGQGRHRLAYKYTTISEKLAQQVQLLGATLGLAGTYTVRPGGEAMIEGRSVNTKTSYCVQLWQASNYDARDPNAKIRHGRHGVFGKVKNVFTEIYNGPVFNLSVVEDESYLVNMRAVHNCSFDAALVGAFYARQLSDLRENGRISYDPLYRPDLEVHVAFDLGIRDQMACWWFQLAGDDINFIDYEQHSNYGFPEWATILKNRGYRYGTYIAPHDIKVRELGAGISRLEAAENLGMPFETCPRHDVMDGVEAVRRTLPRCRFAMSKCADGIDMLGMYRSKTDKAGNPIGPEHSAASHCADALRYAIIYATQVMTQPQMMRVPLNLRR